MARVSGKSRFSALRAAVVAPSTLPRTDECERLLVGDRELHRHDRGYPGQDQLGCHPGEGVGGGGRGALAGIQDDELEGTAIPDELGHRRLVDPVGLQLGKIQPEAALSLGDIPMPDEVEKIDALVLQGIAEPLPGDLALQEGDGHRRIDSLERLPDAALLAVHVEIRDRRNDHQHVEW